MSNFAFMILIIGEKDLDEFRGKGIVNNRCNTRDVLKEKWKNLVTIYEG